MPNGVPFFLFEELMNLYIFSDESGVFDKVHNDKFVFGWLLFLDKKSKDSEHRKYLAAENVLRAKYPKKDELKASIVTNRDKGKLFRSLNKSIKGAVIINQKSVLNSIYCDKKTKQRYLDYAYKIGLKRHLEFLIREGKINQNEVENMTFSVDEHTTATNGIYELREALFQEFKHGTYNHQWNKHFPGIFPNLKSLEVRFCASDKVPLVRGADIVANKVYYNSINDSLPNISNKIFLIKQP